MAARQRPTVANYITKEKYTVGKKHDYEDHTFNGIVFNIKCRTLLPVNCIVIHSVAVRGGLGEMRIFVSKGGYEGKLEVMSEWQLVHHQKHETSYKTLVDMELDSTIVMAPGDTLGVYVHSSEQGDRGVVYDNQRSNKKNSFSDNFIHITSGVADLSSRPFCNESPWGGFYSNSWREHREFVGRIQYECTSNFALCSVCFS